MLDLQITHYSNLLWMGFYYILEEYEFLSDFEQYLKWFPGGRQLTPKHVEAKQ